MKLVYIRTDKNGTIYYEDWQCPRCGGAGQCDKWDRTGKICFECGGTGLRRHPKIVKEYTDEYAAKLEERRKAREAKRIAERHPLTEEELKDLADQALRNKWEAEGFSREGAGYLHVGKTYNNRHKFKSNGGAWNAVLGGFICPVKVACEGVKVIELRAQEMCNEYGYVDPQKAWDLAAKI